jgi:hypothetical protein
MHHEWNSMVVVVAGIGCDAGFNRRAGKKEEGNQAGGYQGSNQGGGKDSKARSMVPSAAFEPEFSGIEAEE